MKLIDKDALVAKIQKLYDKDYHYLPSDIYGYKDEVLAIIDELEVKEVDLEKEITEYINKHFHIRYDETLEKGSDPLNTYDFEDIAKHFFELGLKAQKGE